jgi:hypothetical protein
MTLPGAETMKGGIMGVDCLRCSAGAPLVRASPLVGIPASTCAGMMSTGDCWGVWVESEDVLVLGGLRLSMANG